EAIAQMQQAVAAHPGNAKLQLLYGHLLREVGEQKQAVDAYRSALAIQPGMGEAYWSLANLKTVHFAEADLQGMQEQLARSLPVGSSRISLEFALGKALEDAGRYEQSFQHYAHGNNLQRLTVFYDGELLRLGVQRSKALYTPKFFEQRSGW